MILIFLISAIASDKQLIIKYITEVLEEKEREDFSRLKVIKKQRDG